MRRLLAVPLLTATAVGAGTAVAATASLLQPPRFPSRGAADVWDDDIDRHALVLGIGGVPGAAWEAAVLAHLERTGSPARDARLVIGTSAGSLVAVLLRSGLTATQFEELAVAGEVDHHGQTVSLPRPGGASSDPWRTSALLGLPWHAAREHRLPHMTAALAGLLPPNGFTLTDLGAAIDRLWTLDHPGQPWPQQPTWIPAVDLWDGQRVVFGADGEPRPTLGAAVAASCAVPGVLAPVRVGSRYYIDGGVVSFTSVDLAAWAGARRITVLNPIARTPNRHPHGMAGALETLVRRVLVRGFQRSVHAARASGVHVHVITPTPAEAAAIGERLLDFSRGERIAAAVRSSRKAEPARA